MILQRAGLIMLLFGMLSACTPNTGDDTVTPSNQNQVTAETSPHRTICPEQRSPMCTKIYRPVCATRDNGVRCVTTPCDSTEQTTYPNGCVACADPRVYSHIPGAYEP